MCWRYPLKKSATGGTSPLVSSNGLYSEGEQVGRRRFSIGRTPLSGISILSRMWPTTSSKATITGVSIDQPRFRVEQTVRSMNPRTLDDPEITVADVTE